MTGHPNGHNLTQHSISFCRLHSVYTRCSCAILLHKNINGRRSISQSVTQQYEDIHYGSKIEFIGNEELPHKRKLIYCSGIQTKIGLSFSTKEMWSEFVCKMYRYWQKVLQKCQSIHLHLCRTPCLLLLSFSVPHPNYRRRNEYDNLEWEGAWHTFHFKTIMI